MQVGKIVYGTLHDNLPPKPDPYDPYQPTPDQIARIVLNLEAWLKSQPKKPEGEAMRAEDV